MKTVINFFIDENRERYEKYLKKTFKGNKEKKDAFEIIFILILESDLEFFFKFLDSLPNSVEYFIWFHLGSFEKGEGERFYDGPETYNYCKTYAINLKPSYLTRSSYHPERIKGEDVTIKYFVNVSKYVEKCVNEGSPLLYNRKRLFVPNIPIIVNFEYDLSGNKFNQWVLKESIEETELQAVFDKLLPIGIPKTVDVLVPGYSGAHVILVSYKEGDIDKECVVKIDKNKNNLSNELIIKEKLKNRSYDQNRYIVANEDEPKQAGEWYALSYRYARGYDPLKKKLKLKDIDNLTELITKTLFACENDFRKKIGELEISSNTTCWTSNKIGKYEGLTFYPTTSLRIIKSIEEQMDRFSNMNEEEGSSFNFLSLIPRGIREDFYEFIKNGKRLAPHLTRVPMGRVHGDFHSSNIMVHEGEEAFRMIDFAFTPEKNDKHAFLDVAKLSIDVEFNLIEDGYFFLKNDVKEILKEWLKIHNAWIEEKINPEKSSKGIYKHLMENTKYNYLKTAYEINDFFVSYLVNDFSDTFLKDEELPKNEIIHHFLLTRLHYLLKYSSYPTIINEKKIFAMQAAYSIFELFENYRKYST